jgi:hypothetical protein
MKIGELSDGLRIIIKYVGAGTYCVCTEHDQIWAGDDDMKITHEDRIKLLALGWFESDEGGWSAHV